MQAITILEEMRKLLSVVNGWTQRATARDMHGYMVSPYSSCATQFCLAGSLERVCANNGISPFSKDPIEARNALCKIVAVHNMYLTSFNDSLLTDVNGVLRAIDDAIELLKENK